MSSIATRTRSLRATARTAAAQGALRVALGTQALRGDPGARLLLPGGRRDPYPLYRRIREQGPLVRTAMAWTSASYDVVDQVLRSQEFGSVPVSQRPTHGRPSLMERMLAESMGDAEQAIARSTSVPYPLGSESLIGTDPPDHTRLRRLVSRAFTPRAVASWRPRVEQIAADLLDDAVRRAGPDGVIDLVEAYATPLPVLVICELLGVPVDDREQLQRWGDAIALTLDFMTVADQRTVVTALDELDVYFTDLFARRRRDPGTDVVDALLAAEHDEPGLSARELLATTLLLLTAGFETTVNLIGNGAALLMRHPEQLQLLRDDPARVPNAVEEMLRHDAPVQRDGRYATAEVSIHGHDLDPGTVVLLMLGGANRDPAVFTEPDRFDVTRPNAAAHLAFASGVHYCLGAALARLEGEIAFTALLDRFDRIEPAGEPTRRRGLVLRGLETLPLRVRARGRVAHAAG